MKKYDDSIISELASKNNVSKFIEEEPAELIQNKFKYTFAGISKDDIIKRSTTDLFNQIKTNL